MKKSKLYASTADMPKRWSGDRKLEALLAPSLEGPREQITPGDFFATQPDPALEAHARMVFDGGGKLERDIKSGLYIFTLGPSQIAS